MRKSAKNQFKFLNIMNNEIKQSKIEPLFHFVKDENGKVVIIAGNYKVSNKTFDTFKQAEMYVGTKPYELIFNTMQVLILKSKENETKDKNPQNK